MALQPAHVVAQRRAEAAGLEEVALHVDDHAARCCAGVERVRVRAGGDRRHHAPAQRGRPRGGRAMCAADDRDVGVGRRRVSCTMRPSHITTMRSDSASSSSRSSLTSSTAAPRVARREDPGVDLGHRGEVEAEARVGGDQQRDVARTARAPAPRAARCRPTACAIGASGPGVLHLEGGDQRARLRAQRAARSQRPDARAAAGRSRAAPCSRPRVMLAARRRCAAAPRAG